MIIFSLGALASKATFRIDSVFKMMNENFDYVALCGNFKAPPSGAKTLKKSSKLR